jgi:AraC family transcriptional regulator, regulatory protein of adaptative response / DNA-3-methyladenine glycosylase II
MELAAAQPLHAPSLLGFLAARAVTGVEEVDGTTYRRSLRLAHGPAVVAADLSALTWELEAGDARDTGEAEGHLRTLFDLGADPHAVDTTLAADPLLRELVEAAPGRRVPGAVDPAEIAFRAVLGQQVSVAAARTQAGRLTARLGEPLPQPKAGITHLFPTPHALATLDPETLPMPRARGRTLVGLATALADGLDPQDRPALLDLPGIGPWTADYVAMRCGDRDVLLETDLGVRKGLARLGAHEHDTDRWRPWRSYAVQHLWSLE